MYLLLAHQHNKIKTKKIKKTMTTMMTKPTPASILKKLKSALLY